MTPWISRSRKKTDECINSQSCSLACVSATVWDVEWLKDTHVKRCPVTQLMCVRHTSIIQRRSCLYLSVSARCKHNTAGPGYTCTGAAYNSEQRPFTTAFDGRIFVFDRGRHWLLFEIHSPCVERDLAGFAGKASLLKEQCTQETHSHM